IRKFYTAKLYKIPFLRLYFTIRLMFVKYLYKGVYAMNSNEAYLKPQVNGSNFLKKLARWRSSLAEAENSGIERDNDSLLESIQQARQEWLVAVSNFDQAENEDMIDYYIYRMKACQVRYNYLLKKAKEMGLKRDAFQ